MALDPKDEEKARDGLVLFALIILTLIATVAVPALVGWLFTIRGN